MANDRPANADRLFHERVLPLRPYLVAMALRLRCAPGDAHDVVQDVLERAYRNAGQLHQVRNPRSWLTALLHRRFIDLYRRRRLERENTAPLESAGEVAFMGPSDAPAWSTITPEQLAQAVDHLENEFRSVYVMHALERRSYKEIAERLGIPVATVGSRMNRARHKLRGLLFGERPADPSSGGRP